MIALSLGDCSFFSAVYSRSLWIEHAPRPPAWSCHDEISYNPRMKNLLWSSIALPVVLALAALPSPAKPKVDLKDAQGQPVCTVILWEQGSSVGLQLHLYGLPPGEHAIHFHQNAKCDAPYFK